MQVRKYFFFASAVVIIQSFAAESPDAVELEGLYDPVTNGDRFDGLTKSTIGEAAVNMPVARRCDEDLSSSKRCAYCLLTTSCLLIIVIIILEIMLRALPLDH